MRKSKNFLTISDRNLKAFERLAETMKDRPLALVGAGVSVGAGYPTWDGLMDAFNKTIQELPVPPDAPKYLRQLARVTDPLWKAEEYRRLMKKVGYEALIWSTFRPKNSLVTDVTRAIVDLDFSHVLTTNYDVALETAYQSMNKPIEVINWTERDKVGTFLRDISRRGEKRYFVYLHGRFDEPENIVLTERDYVKRYLVGDEASKKLFAIFMVRPVVFLGFSLTDPELTHLIRSTQGYAQSETSTHFVILPLNPDEDEGAIAGWLSGKYGIEPVFYAMSPKHEQLLEVLEELMRFRSKKAEEELKVLSKTNTRKQEKDPDDPHKGQWGGRAERNGRVLSAKVSQDEKNWFYVQLKVASANPSKKPLTGQVTFHLHPTFSPDKVTVEVINGIAEYDLYSYGAFTVGAVAENGKTRLELDLAALPEAPKRFKDQ
ncbi:MAG: hypothetical protein QOE77_2228 [Blastocatellia bacterium]|jgi:hypothetical protein|nr:hypothetical protein [Blastocatellia bacterium]